MFQKIFPQGNPVPAIPNKEVRGPRLKESLDMDVLNKGLEEARKKEQAAMKILDILEIPHSGSGSIPTVQVTVLVDILMDPEKFKKLSSMIKNKAFW